MRISFLQHGTAHLPMGGFRVVYEYARALATLGHEVTVIHAPYAQLGSTRSSRRLKNAVNFASRALHLFGGYRPDRWFKVPNSVKILWTPSLHPHNIPNADAVFATAWETAEWMSIYPPRCGSHYYLIQGLETCFEGVDEARVMATWKMPFSRIVISHWLLEIARGMGLDAYCVPNGLDHIEFSIDIPPAQRNPRKVLILYHPAACKDFQAGLQAILLVRDVVPDLQVTVFGIFERPKILPKEFEYFRNPHRSKHRELYNQAAIFISPSRVEGWGLPPCEAVQCGAALSVTDIGGHRMFAFHEKTALLSPPGDVQEMAKNIVRLTNDSPLRLRLAEEAHQYVQQFTWERAVNSLLQILSGNNP